MKKTDPEKLELSFDEFDEQVNPPAETNDFDRILMRAWSRRDVLKNVIALGSITALGSLITPTTATAAMNRFGFSAVSANNLDELTVPKGFRAEVVARWGDPLWSDGAEFDHVTRGTAASQAAAFGDNIDGMEVFAHNDKMLMVVNNEYCNRSIIWGNREAGVAPNEDDINKGKMAHGLTVVEIRQNDGSWSIVKDSPFNRRVTPDTVMQLTGPAAGHALLQTRADPTGNTTLGTYNNCGNGSTPWGTYLACEENFNGYFSTNDKTHTVSAELARYGFSANDWGYEWARVDERFNIAKHPNEPNRMGYVVEIDPRDSSSTPRKLTALGRFKHENAELVVNADGRIVVYMGDDERGEFIYRYVSNGVFASGSDTNSLLEDGKLYAAKFHANGTGEWLPLTAESSGMASMAEVCIHTRIAASTVGATTMDRPEWVAANPNAPEVYCSLTNNKLRGIQTNAGGDPTPVGGPNPREANVYGQIVRWRPKAGDHTSARFAWDLYALAGNPAVHDDIKSGSENISADNMFNSPDGLKFDSHGMLWIQTDGDYSDTADFAGHGNNQMLVGDPVTGEIRRFLVGPKQCEVTGLTWSTDRRTMFIGIQHPGGDGEGHWPEGGDSTPRSAIVAIQREDGAAIG